LEVPETPTEFYILPVIGPSSQMKIAFHNKLADCDPITLDRTVFPDEVDGVKGMIERFMPDLLHCPVSSEVCMYTMTSDGHFYLGKRPASENVYGVALAGHGFKFAPVLGEILSDLMTDASPEVDTSMFSPDRFDR
jgi:sarcosine oxidase